MIFSSQLFSNTIATCTNPCNFTYIKDTNNIHLDIDHLLLHLLENVIKFLYSHRKT